MKTITLTDSVRQDKTPPAFMVFAYKDIDFDYKFFPDESSALDYAAEQEEKSQSPEASWPIYALWAADWAEVARPLRNNRGT